MAHPHNHAISSVRKWGGTVEDYIRIHDFMDSSKAHYANWRHRAVLHNSFGIYLAEQVFGSTITISTGKQVPVRLVAEQHVIEDLGCIPTVSDWLRAIGDSTKIEPWMTRGVDRSVVRNEEVQP